MTPKEKAKELVDKLYQTTPNENYLNDPIGVGRYEAWKQAKQCALIAIDEILDECNNWSGGSINDGWEKRRFDYWQEVKQEIDKL